MVPNWLKGTLHIITDQMSLVMFLYGSITLFSWALARTEIRTRSRIGFESSILSDKPWTNDFTLNLLFCYFCTLHLSKSSKCKRRKCWRYSGEITYCIGGHIPLLFLTIKETGEFWWTSVKWRRPFILGAAILNITKETFSFYRTEL